MFLREEFKSLSFKFLYYRILMNEKQTLNIPFSFLVNQKLWILKNPCNTFQLWYCMYLKLNLSGIRGCVCTITNPILRLRLSYMSLSSREHKNCFQVWSHIKVYSSQFELNDKVPIKISFCQCHSQSEVISGINQLWVLSTNKLLFNSFRSLSCKHFKLS